MVFALFWPNLTSDRHVLRLVRKPLNWRVSSWARFFRFRTLVRLYFGRNLKSDNFGIFGHISAYFGIFRAYFGLKLKNDNLSEIMISRSDKCNPRARFRLDLVDLGFDPSFVTYNAVAYLWFSKPSKKTRFYSWKTISLINNAVASIVIKNVSICSPLRLPILVSRLNSSYHWLMLLTGGLY